MSNLVAFAGTQGAGHVNLFKFSLQKSKYGHSFTIIKGQSPLIETFGRVLGLAYTSYDNVNVAGLSHKDERAWNPDAARICQTAL